MTGGLTGRGRRRWLWRWRRGAMHAPGGVAARRGAGGTTATNWVCERVAVGDRPARCAPCPLFVRYALELAPRGGQAADAATGAPKSSTLRRPGVRASVERPRSWRPPLASPAPPLPPAEQHLHCVCPPLSPGHGASSAGRERAPLASRHYCRACRVPRRGGGLVGGPRPPHPPSPTVVAAAASPESWLSPPPPSSSSVGARRRASAAAAATAGVGLLSGRGACCRGEGASCLSCGMNVGIGGISSV